jgi:hypothetical protein
MTLVCALFHELLTQDIRECLKELTSQVSIKLVKYPAPLPGRAHSDYPPGLTPGANFGKSLRDIFKRTLVN